MAEAKKCHFCKINPAITVIWGVYDGLWTYHLQSPNVNFREYQEVAVQRFDVCQSCSDQKVKKEK